MPRKKSGFTQKKYYKQNKQGISWVKKQRYRDDPEYREKILQRAKEAHLKKKGISGVERVDSNIFRIDGITYYTVNEFFVNTFFQNQYIFEKITMLEFQ